MAALWSEQTRFANWLRVELAATDVLAEAGLVPAQAAKELRQHAAFTIPRIHELENDLRHDVLSFTTCVAEHVKAAGSDSARWLHFGLTSTDVVDTAQALTLVEASAIIRRGLVGFRETLRTRAIEFKHTPTIGRTHGVHVVRRDGPQS
jgi:adenylosuccinate lyase